ncbi:MAG: SusD/RagB family nutrient-binding outer membrane lipoprotein [Bacteroidetes bacterium]|nr:SusD/RagB family nutrient-binding outer membrane lipoprotein [Bacteroidota bacterium]
MNIKTISVLILISVFLSTSCTKDFEDINTNPAIFTTASDGSLFNDVISSLMIGGEEHLFLNNEILYNQTQMAFCVNPRYPIGGMARGIEAPWSGYYSNLPNIRELQRRFNKAIPSAEINNMKAMVKIIMAYKTFKITDFFGDVPYSEAGYGFMDVTKLRPKFDSQRSIYLALLDELKWAQDSINITATAEPFATFKNFDKLFSGNLTMWKKFANSLRLRYAMRMSDKEPVLAGQIIADIINNHKPVLTGIDFSSVLLEKAAIYPGSCGEKNSSVIYALHEDAGLRMGSNFWHLLSSHDSTDGSGVFDARAYLFFETNGSNKWVACPQLSSSLSEGGVPYMEQRNSVGGFAVKEVAPDKCKFSPLNYFLVSDEVNMPEILMTGAEVHFLKAEAYMRGIGVAQSESDASNEYLAGVQASLTFWTNTLNGTRLKNDGTPFSTLITIPSQLTFAYLQTKIGLWNFSTSDDKLSHIYSQQLIDFFKQPAEAFALVRRVYGKIPREINGTDGQLKYYRFVIPASEITYNQANWMSAYGSKDDVLTKVWWMK